MGRAGARQVGLSRGSGALAAFAVLVLLAGCGASVATSATEIAAPATTAPDRTSSSPAPATVRPTTAPTATTASEPVGASALSVLAGLPVKGRAPKTGYERAEFGPDWFDIDDNGCDTRSDVLRAVLTDPVLEGACDVVGGTLLDLYSADVVEFAGAAIDLDHVVALGDAWQKGAQQLDLETRTAFANDPLNLVPTDASLNRQKGDGDAATWLPPARAYRCTYVALQIAVKARYALWVTAPEKEAMTKILTGCPGTTLPAAAAGPPPEVAVDVPVPGPSTPPAPAPAPGTGGSPSPGVVFYENCDAVRAAGRAPILLGQPGFSPDFDGDGDGIGCES